VLEARTAQGARLCLGLSGGLDSVVLLHLLTRLREPLGFLLSAVHVHHGLSSRADAWVEFCAACCAEARVPLAVERVTLTISGQGVEAAARQARYAVYTNQPADCIVLAHQQDDQAETLLLNLLRGAGVAGLAAMPVERPLAGGGMRLLRPLLAEPRSELAAYALAHGLEWVEDASNLEGVYARNHLRHAVLPAVEARFPAYRDTLARTAAHMADCRQLLEELARIDAAHAIDDTGLEVAYLAGLSRPRARNLLRWYLDGLGGPAWPAARLDALIEQCLAAGPDNRLLAGQADLRLRLWRGRLRPVADPCAGQLAERVWRGEEHLPFGAGWIEFMPGRGQGLSRERLEAGRVTIGQREAGEHFRPDCRRPRRDLKKLFQELAIPPWRRNGLPVLRVAGDPAWVAEVGVDCAYQAGPEEPSLLISWHPAGR
jgi:tRNA(Ile)-lysidine synthase